MAKEEAKTPEADGAAPAPPKKGMRGLLMWAGYFILSTTLMVAVALVVVQKRRAQQSAVLAQQAALKARADSLAHLPDSLRHAAPPKPKVEDSLKAHIQTLKREVAHRDDSLHKAVDTTRRLQTQLEHLERELDTLRQRDVMLSSAEVARLARVFGSMQPRKAAPIMQKMDNPSVAAILLSIEERTAAKILAAMAPDRAAGISTLIREQAKEKARRVKAKG